MTDDGAGAGPTRASPLRRLVELPARAGGVLATLLILVLLCQTIYAVVLRYVVGAPLLWSDELIGYLLVALIMCGAAEAYRQGDHISIDLLASQLGARGQRVVAILSDIAVLAVSAVLGWSAWDAISFAMAFGSYSSGEIEIATWIPQIPLVVGAVLLGSISISRIAGRLLGERSP